MKRRALLSVFSVALGLILLLAYRHCSQITNHSLPTVPLKQSDRQDADTRTHDRAFDSGGESTASKSHGLPAAKRELGRAIAFLSLDRARFWSARLEALHSGASPDFTRFSERFREAAGSQLVPITRALLAECKSEETAFLLAAVLGDSGMSEAVPVLLEIADKGLDPHVVASALYSIGLTKSPSSHDVLVGWLNRQRSSNNGLLQSVYPQILAGMGQLGSASCDFLLAEARARKENQKPSRADIVGMIRGADALSRLRSVLENDPDRDVRLGAAIALGHGSSLDWLEGGKLLTDPDLLGRALLAPRNLPDIWNATVDERRRIAERAVSLAGIPTGDITRDSVFLPLAPLLPDSRARALYEGLTTSLPSRESTAAYVSWLSEIVAGFGNQPDLQPRVSQLGKAAGLSDEELRRALEMGVLAGSLPGRDLEPSGVLRSILDNAVNPQSDRWEISLSLAPLMRSGFRGDELSRALIEASRTNSAEYIGNVVDGISRALHTSGIDYDKLTWTNPHEFLAFVVRTSNSNVQALDAAYPLLVSGDPGELDAATVQSVRGLIDRVVLDARTSDQPIAFLPQVVGAFFARFGTYEDLGTLSRLPESFPYPANWNSAKKAEMKRDLERSCARAIDAIRMTK